MAGTKLAKDKDFCLKTVSSVLKIHHHSSFLGDKGREGLKLEAP